jgi:hypothetical protein
MAEKPRQNAKFGFATALTSSALAPSLALCAIGSIPCFLFAAFSADAVVRYWLMLLGSMPIVHTLWVIHKFAGNDPTLLQSEHHQLRLAVLESNKMVELSPEALTPLLGSSGTLERNPHAINVTAEVPHDAS